jgi:hypothetical protein
MRHWLSFALDYVFKFAYTENILEASDSLFLQRKGAELLAALEDRDNDSL